MGMTAKMPDEKELSRWLRKQQFSIFVRELNLERELAGKEYSSEEQLAATISLCRSETHVGKTLAQRELVQKSPKLGRKLFAAFSKPQ